MRWRLSFAVVALAMGLMVWAGCDRQSARPEPADTKAAAEARDAAPAEPEPAEEDPTARRLERVAHLLWSEDAQARVHGVQLLTAMGPEGLPLTDELPLLLLDRRKTICPTTGEVTTPAAAALEAMQELGTPAAAALVNAHRDTVDTEIREVYMDALMRVQAPDALTVAEKKTPEPAPDEPPAEEKKEPAMALPATVNDIPGIAVEVKHWQPTDISIRLEAAILREEIKPVTPKPGSPGAKLWRASRFIIDQEDNWHNIKTLIGNQHGTHLLFTPDYHRAYALMAGDEKLLGLPDDNFALAAEPNEETTTSGAATYSVVWPSPDVDLKPGTNRIMVHVLAEPARERKVLFKSVESKGRTRVSRIDLSRSGNRGCLSLANPDLFYLFDLDTLKIVHGGKTRFETMNADGSIIIYNHDLEYRRRELISKREKVLWTQMLTKWGFMLSPDGNFCVCLTESHGPNYIDVYVNSKNQHWHIDHPITRDWFARWRIENDGTIYAGSGIYAYRHGRYVWATPGEPAPKGLRITPEQFNGP